MVRGFYANCLPGFLLLLGTITSNASDLQGCRSRERTLGSQAWARPAWEGRSTRNELASLGEAGNASEITRTSYTQPS